MKGRKKKARQHRPISQSRHMAKLRQSYKAAAAKTRDMVNEWEPLSNEVWEKLDARQSDSLN